MLKQILIAVFFQLVIFLSVFAQQDVGTVKGRVVDQKTLLPIPYASVYINYTTLGVYSDGKGEFLLTKIPSGPHELIVSSIGYLPYQAKINIKDTIPLTALVKLTTVVLKEVTVSAKRDNKWAGQLTKFEKLFFGNSVYASQCKILNPYVLDLSENAQAVFTAQADAPLVIENLSLGYRLFYQIKNFTISATNFNIAGSVRFEEIETLDTALISLWRRKRADAYRGSTRHLLKSIIDQNVKEEGFVLYEDKSGTEEILRDARFLSNLNKRVFNYDETGTVTKTESSGQYSISFPFRLEIHYLNKSVPPKLYANVPNPVSWIEVKNKTLAINKEGIVFNPASMTVLGAMGDARIAEMLPYDYSLEKEKKPLVSRKIVIPPLTYLVEKPYLHTDKSYYYRKEIIWIKGYMNYVAPTLKDSLSHVVYVELIDSKGKGVIKKIFAVNDGQFTANLNLPALIEKGDYQLRAYTRWMLNFDSELIFTKPVKILEDNEFATSTGTDSTKSEVKGISINGVKETYVAREKITLTIEVKDFYDYAIASSLSISVTDLKQAVPAQNEKTILNSYSISEKWLPDTSALRPAYTIQYGIELGGHFFNSKKKPVQGKLTFVEDDSNNVFTITTGKDGRFFFPTLQLYDTVKLSMEAKSLKRNKKGITILDSIPLSPAISKIEPLKIEIEKKKEIFHHPIDTYDELPAHILSEVTINDTKMDNHLNKVRGAHLSSDYSISGDWFRETNSVDLLYSLQSKVPGLRIGAVLNAGGFVQRYIYLGGPGQFTGGSPSATEPLVLIDGIAVNGQDPTAADQISSLNVNQIDRIEVIKQGAGASYGARGGNGVIAIYTKNENKLVVKPLYDKTKLELLNIRGFASTKKFISPDYSISTETKPDYRSTIYWNPSLNTDGKAPATISFFAADIPTNYRVVVEGITKDGNPVRGEKIIQVKSNP